MTEEQIYVMQVSANGTDISVTKIKYETESELDEKVEEIRDNFSMEVFLTKEQYKKLKEL